MEPFVHLHVASAYSLRYGVATPAALVRRAAASGMDMLALTDRDGLYGAVKHVKACQEAGIAPILGADLAVHDEQRAVFLATGGGGIGWSSLCRLVTAAHAGERGEPRVSPPMIAEHATGLIVLLGPSSDVGRAMADRRPDLAMRLLAGWREIAEVAIEIVHHHDRGSGHRAARLLDLARTAGVPAVLTNAVRCLDQADSPVTQVLDVSRKLVPLHWRHLDDRTGQAYFKSGPELRRVAEEICAGDRSAAAELLAGTRRLAERCVLDPAADLGMGRNHLPELPGVADAHAELRARSEAGLIRRGFDRPAGRPAAARERLEHELAIIGRKGLAAYFLVVAEATELIRARGIRCAIRGSGAGSLVNHLIGIGDVDPLRHDLVMERFLADSRPGLPDIDIDVESARRLEAYRAIFERYGADRVACVSMMETYRARSAIRDTGQAIGLPPHEIDAIAKAFPHVRARRIRAALDDLPELRRSNLGQSRLAELFRIAERLDGLPRHVALHPCGVLLSNTSLRHRTAVEPSLLGFPMSQFDKDDVETMGLLKLDVLGVRMQSAMAHSVVEIGRTTGRRVDLEEIDHEDEPTYEMIRRSQTLGCFQIESPGQRELVAKLVPRTLNDLIIDISLFRPGPVNSDMITPYLETRHGWRAPDYPHPHLADVLRESHGVVVFHEQVLRIIDIMTGCGASEAEAARRRLGGEESRVEVAEFFRERALARGYAPDVVDRVWETLNAFGAFGFCKAHAAAFALPTYQSAWLKRHHPAAFYAGVLTHDPGMYPKRAILDDARRFGVPILPLEVNRSGAQWRVEPVDDDGRARLGIRVALAEVKGINEAEIARIIEGRPFHGLADFWQRARVSRPVAERMVLVGAFDALAPGPSRRDLLCQVGALDRAGGRLAKGVGAGQLPFGYDTADAAPDAGGGSTLGIVEEIPVGELPEMTPAEIVETELAVLGMDVSRHVLGFYDELLAELGVVRSAELLGHRSRSEVLVAGVKIATQTPAVRSGRRVVFATVEDPTGPVDATFFESVQEHTAGTVFGSWLLVIRGRLRRTGGRAVSLNASACWDLSDLYELWQRAGIDAVRDRIAGRPQARLGATGGRIVHANGFELSPYADVAPAGAPIKSPPAKLWHASGGSTGGWSDGRPHGRSGLG